MERVARIRRRTFEVLEVARPGDDLSRTVDLMIVGLVFTNVCAIVLESVEPLATRFHDLFLGFDRLSVAAFSAEFLARVWAAAEGARDGERPWRARLRYLASPMALADLAAIAPFYLSAFVQLDLRFLRMMRLLRLLKLTRYSNAMGRMTEVLSLQRNALAAAFFLLSLMVVFAATAIYMVESEVQPDRFGSIPDAMWWAVVTLTTVGYGDATPITPLGKLLASTISIIGIGMVALPTSLLASGFSEVMTRNREALEGQMRRALEDGVVDEEEARAYAALARRLHAQESVAEEIYRTALAERRIPQTETACPHCGKAIGD